MQEEPSTLKNSDPIVDESSSTPVAEPLAQPIERVKASIENWKRKLLDLSKRNRALNFKMNKVSTITIVDEQPAEVFRQLCLKNEGLRFKPASERSSQATSVSDKDNEESASAGKPVVPTPELVPEPTVEATMPIDEDEEVQSIGDRKSTRLNSSHSQISYA